MFGLPRKTEHFDDWLPSNSRFSWIPSWIWRLSENLATLGLVVVLFAILALLATQSREVRAMARRVLPVWVVDKLGHIAPEEEQPRLEKKAGATLERAKSQTQPSPTRTKPEYFGLGSTAADVRAVQGPPDRQARDVWEYGGSKVYFVNGRVVGWWSAPGRPLKTR